MKQMKTEMRTDLKKVECDPECGFMVRSHDEAELKKMVVSHVKNIHNMDVSMHEIEGKIMSA